MKKPLVASLLAITTLLSADSFVDPRHTPNEYPDNPFYGFISTGYAWTLDCNIKNATEPFWDVAKEGYNSSLGQSPFLTLGFGIDLFQFLHLDLSYSYYQTFHYEKHQTGSSNTPGFTGSQRTRFFDLDHQNILFNIAFYPWKFELGSMGFIPFAGAGVGSGFSRVSNFHTVGFSNNVGSTTSIGQAATRASFAWQAEAGLRLQPRLQHLSFDFGYRYYAGGTFQGPNVVTVNTPPTNGGNIGADPSSPWQGSLAANEFYFGLNLAY